MMCWMTTMVSLFLAVTAAPTYCIDTYENLFNPDKLSTKTSQKLCVGLNEH